MREDIVLPSAVCWVMDALERAGYEAWAVGGCVRDALREGGAPKDWDVATAATPEQVTAALPACRILPTGIRHGTLTVFYENTQMEVTTYRTEGAYRDARRPESVAFTADFCTDAARRDFTVNAMGFHPKRGLCDPYGGLGDLAAGIIRVVGKPEERFGEDALRILRALRFAATLGFKLEAQTALAVRDMKAQLRRLAPERVQKELTGLLAGPSAPSVVRDFADVFAEILPLDMAEETFAALEKTACDAALRLAVLLRNVQEPRAVLYALRFPRKIIIEVKERLRHRDIPGFLDGLIREGACWRVSQLAVRGSDLYALGLRGAEISRALNAMLRKVLAGQCPNEQEALLTCVSSENMIR